MSNDPCRVMPTPVGTNANTIESTTHLTQCGLSYENKSEGCGFR